MKTKGFICYPNQCEKWIKCGGTFGKAGKKLIETTKEKKIYACKYFIPKREEAI